jgi:hypothetical protein
MRALLVVALVLLAGVAEAQVCESNCVAVVGSDVSVFTASDDRASGYLLKRNGAVEVTPFAVANGIVEFHVGTWLPAGAHTFAIELVGVEETTPATLTITEALTCSTNGVTYAAGASLTATMHNKLVDGYIAARQREGWANPAQRKAKNQTTVTMTCAGLP